MGFDLTHDHIWDPLVVQAKLFAAQAHGPQLRKYSHEPYIKHCSEVAQVLNRFNYPPEVMAAGWLHDTIEDTWVTYPVLYELFGKTVADLVREVSDVSKASLYKDLSRAERKALDRQHLANASMYGKAVKLADVCSNTKDIVANDPQFAKVYVPEMLLLLPKLFVPGVVPIWDYAHALVHEAVAELAG